jgi:hypothetical protein
MHQSGRGITPTNILNEILKETSLFTTEGKLGLD